uniref:Uncharacterized protein n=1 Tax=Canis lupus dingo TaxID=286419 RepID=A0A8C0LBP1_CANLU
MTGRGEALLLCGSQWSPHESSSIYEAPGIWDKVGGWLCGVCSFTMAGNDFRRNVILSLGLAAAGLWPTRNLNDLDLLKPQPGWRGVCRGEAATQTHGLCPPACRAADA